MDIGLNSILRYKKYLMIAYRISFRKPLAIIRIFYNYFKMVILRQKTARKIEIAVTYDCQCKCAKCSSHPMKNPERKRFTLEEIRKAVKDILSLGVVHINLTGGEPLLEKEIFE